MDKGILTVDFKPRKDAIYTQFTVEFQDVPKLIKVLQKFLDKKNENINQICAISITNDHFR